MVFFVGHFLWGIFCGIYNSCIYFKIMSQIQFKPILKKMPAILVFLCCIFCSVVEAKSNFKNETEAYQSAKKSYQKFKEENRYHKYRERWIQTINQFLLVAAHYPKGKYAADSLYLAGTMYMDLHRLSFVTDDLQQAKLYFDDLIRRFPKSRYADDGWFYKGQIQLKLRSHAQAEFAFQQVLKEYPKGDMVIQAKQHLEALAQTLAAAQKTQDHEKPESKLVPTKTITIEEFKTWSNPDYTRIVVYLSDNTQYSVGELPANESMNLPPRVYLDFQYSQIATALKEPIVLNDGLLRQVRAGQFDKDTVRVVLDIQSMNTKKIFMLENPWRLVIDISGNKDTLEKHEPIAKQELEPQKENKVISVSPKETENAQAVKKEPENKKRKQEKIIKKEDQPFVVVVDAGHGGKDHGATGSRGVKEKDVVLKIANKLRDTLAKNKNIKVIMTREDDTFLQLEERTAIANTVKADLFISVHANAHRMPSVQGISTYYLNTTDDNYSRRLAQLENRASEQGMDDLQFILADLSMKTNVDSSYKLANSVQNSMVDSIEKNYGHVRNLGVKSALFYVLLGAKMPSVLIETSFLTNPTEEKRLNSNNYQSLLANAITDGVYQFIERLEHTKVALK